MKIALTFDVERDIPNFLNTDFGVKIGLNKILSILDDYQIKSTFFCTGTIVKHQPQIVELIESRGHEIACHSLNHERLTELTFDECKEIILKNKEIVEKRCQNSEVIGFRAPYLKPPKFIFKLLNDLGFKYDSSIRRHKNSEYYIIPSHKIREFYPSSVYIYFRLPMFYYFVKKWIFRKELNVLYFHVWEAINIKELILKQTSKLNSFINLFFRLDRWINTGKPFLIRIKKFIKEAVSKNVEFVTLKQLIGEVNNKIKNI
ncbi:MAG: polysaccharide deacetylase family protein [Candidatus Hodarchaeota archaeon]